MRNRLVVLASTALVALALSVPAHGATYVVQARDNYFSPVSRSVSMGNTVRFTNTGEVSHTTTVARGVMSGWNKWIAPGQSFDRTMPYAGTFAYYCAPHGTATSGMRGTIKVPPRVTPSTGTRSTVFTVRLASVNAPSGWVYDVQIRKGTGSWTWWRTGRTTATTTFKATSAGTYSFRARLRKASNNATSGLSPHVRASVS